MVLLLKVFQIFLQGLVQSNTSLTTVEASTQTTLNGISVSKFVETVNILSEVLDKETENMLLDSVNNSIKNITD